LPAAVGSGFSLFETPVALAPDFSLSLEQAGAEARANIDRSANRWMRDVVMRRLGCRAEASVVRA